MNYLRNTNNRVIAVIPFPIRFIPKVSVVAVLRFSIHTVSISCNTCTVLAAILDKYSLTKDGSQTEELRIYQTYSLTTELHIDIIFIYLNLLYT